MSKEPLNKKPLNTDTIKFLKKEVRTVYYHGKTYIVLLDCFRVLGLVDGEGNWNYSKKKIIRFLTDIDKLCDLKELQVTSKSNKKKARETQVVDCLLLERLPVVLTQFRPQKDKLEQLDIWKKFMKKVDKILEEAKLNKFILDDREHQRLISDAITRETDEEMQVINSNICTLMAKILGVYPEIKRIKKDDLKIYNADTSIDLLEVRQEVLNMYEQMLLMDMSKSEIHERILKYIKKKYEL